MHPVQKHNIKKNSESSRCLNLCKMMSTTLNHPPQELTKLEITLNDDLYILIVLLKCSNLKR